MPTLAPDIFYLTSYIEHSYPPYPLYRFTPRQNMTRLAMIKNNTHAA